MEMVAKVPTSRLLLASLSTLFAVTDSEIPWELSWKHLPYVLQIIQSHASGLIDACGSLHYILKQCRRHHLSIPKSVLDTVPYLIPHLTHHCKQRSHEALNAIASGSDEESQVLLDSNILDVLNQVLDDWDWRLEACTLIAKFTAGNARQIACVVDNGTMTKVMNIVRNPDKGMKIWREASWAVANALDGRRSPEQFQSLVVHHRAFEPLCYELAEHGYCYAESQCLVYYAESECLTKKTTERLLRCLDQATIHLPSLQQGADFTLVSETISKIEQIFAMKDYNTYRRESKNGNW